MGVNLSPRVTLPIFGNGFASIVRAKVLCHSRITLLIIFFLKFLSSN